MTNTFAALQQQESQAALASAADASASQNKSGVDFRHAPVAASVQVVTSHIKSHPRVRSTLTTLQSYLPALVTEKAIAGAGQLQALTLEYGTPLVARVDGKLSNAIETLLAAPATSLEYGAKKLSAVDQFAFAHTPAALQPAYTSARTFTIEKATIAGHKVVELKKARAEPLWERLTSGLDQIRAQLAAVRSAITNAPSNAFASLHLVDRLNQLQAKLHGAIEAAQAKGTQARALANDLIASFSEAAVAFEGYLESRFLTKDQAAWIHSLWSQLLTQANNLKGAVLGSASPASSRRSSSASETSVASFATDVEDSPVSVGAPVTAAASASTSAGTDRAHAVESSKPSYASVFPNLATPADSGVEVAASADDTTGLSPLPADVDAEPTTTASTSSGAQKRKNKAGKNKATGSQQPHDL